MRQKEDQATVKPRIRREITMAEYVHRRNGVPLGDSNSLRNMLYRSFGASSFAKFWQYWNPIWGYGLGKYVNAPIQRWLSPGIALIFTFVISGGIHDAATMMVRGSVAFLFTPWFFFLGLGVVLGRMLKMDLSTRQWWLRAVVNSIYLGICLMLAIIIKRMLGIP